MEKPKHSRSKRVPRRVQQLYTTIPLRAAEERRCVGHLVGASVWIRDSGDMKWIFNNGFFGKGSFSKSAPSFVATGAYAPPAPRQQYAPSDESDLRYAHKRQKLDSSHSDDHQVSVHRILDPDAHHEALEPTVAPSSTGDVSWDVEHLQLCLEEAFFLVFAFGCLDVFPEEEPSPHRPFSPEEFWQKCTWLKKDFVVQYAAYHHFRAKGWVTKPGIKYGVDWILYRKGPVFFHSDYSVTVRPVQAARASLTGAEDQEREVTWHAIANLVRVSGQVAKETLFCYVVFPSEEESENGKEPALLSVREELERVQIHEQIIRRWLPEREREADARKGKAKEKEKEKEKKKE